ncbi:MAG TPA: protein-tyrosine phosphatase family protein, partial [Gemmatimonadaceae bacterium]|nr:protein-tyrosine phosphatase family protein [Gemmatimonadaceae bacterium]
MTEIRKPFPCCYWLPDGRLIAGQYPGSSDPEDARERIAALLDAGVRTFINLTEEHEPLEPYEELLNEEASARDIEVEHIRISIGDANTPGPGVMETILDKIRETQQANRIPYVHCWGGIGRTGTVVACHLMDQGHSADEALELVQAFFETYGRNWP